ncbi:MAG TPA: helix-turn-helix domain-containing protein, partial [Candidatus Limnocylindrales bacterium]
MERRQPDLGELVRQYRAASGLTQEELAERAGLSARAVSDIERGRRLRVYPDTALRLANALSIEGEERRVFRELSRGRLDGLALESRHAVAEAPAAGTPLDRFLGRQRELDALLAVLRSPDVRIVTLTGTGGIGKTRLALEASARCRAEFRDGCRVVPLADIRDASHVAAAIARALGVRAERDTTFSALVRHLGTRQVLLVLDTFEHLLDAAPVLVDLLTACPGLKVLVTSRAPLRVSGEHEMAVPALALPPLVSATATLGDLAGCPSVELLVERIRAVNPAFELDAANATVLRDICVRLAGIPLAIELAARRTRHMSVDALQERLVDRLDVLSAGARDLPPRQQTMRATISWSYELLDEEARRLFRTL